MNKRLLRCSAALVYRIVMDLVFSTGTGNAIACIPLVLVNIHMDAPDN